MPQTEDQSVTVYVIDDEPSVRDSLSLFLRSVGLAVRTFACARDFLATPVRSPGCLILDIRMRGIDGFQLQSKIAGTAHDLPTIVITGDGNDETRRRALEGGAESFFHKPFDDEELLKAIDAAIRSRSPPED